MPKFIRFYPIMTRFLRVFFYLLYHQMAWMYDFVAYVVSVGMWQDWIKSITPELRGPRLLELGHGPGHLQIHLAEKGFQIFGLDESRQMGRIAFQRIRKNQQQPLLSRGYAQNMPFQDDAFDEIIATFPSEYIFDPKTLAEIKRVLSPHGRLVVLPLAWITGKKWLQRWAAWLFRVTEQSPNWDKRYLAPYLRAGFQTQLKRINQKSWSLMIIIAKNHT